MTGPSTSSGQGVPSSFPPPGFDAEKAKKPLPQDVAQRESATRDTTDAVKSSSPVENVTAADRVGASSDLHPSAGMEKTEKKAAAAEEAKKLTIGQKIKHEIQHYWDGTKLLAAEARISTRLGVKMAAGYELSRRENKQVCGDRTRFFSILPALSK